MYDDRYANVVTPDSFEIEEHYYSRVLNAQQHPLVTSFMSLTNKVVAARYCHLHPSADQEELLKLLTEPR